MKVYSLEYERMIRDPKFSEAIDNQELGTLYQWMWEILQNDDAFTTSSLHNDKHSKKKKEK